MTANSAEATDPCVGATAASHGEGDVEVQADAGNATASLPHPHKVAKAVDVADLNWEDCFTEDDLKVCLVDVLWR